MSSPYLLERGEAAVCVVDIQEKLAIRMEEKSAVVANSRMLALAALRLGMPVLVTEQYPRGMGRTVPEIAAAMGRSYAPIERMCFDCADEPEFMDQLKRLKRKQVVLCGMEAHVCVLQTCLELLDRGYRIHVPTDAVCSRRAEHKAIALAQMRQAGAVVTCAEAVVFQLLGKVGTPEFKDLLDLIK